MVDSEPELRSGSPKAGYEDWFGGGLVTVARLLIEEHQARRNRALVTGALVSAGRFILFARQGKRLDTDFRKVREVL